MSYRNHYSGSPWQQGGPPFGVSNYGQNYGGYNDQYSMMNAGYGRNQGGYGGMYGSGSMSQMRSMSYGGPSPSRYGNDRMGGGRQMMSRGQMQRKRLPQRSPAGGPRSKRPNLSGSDRRVSKPRRRRDSRGGSKGRGRDHSDDEGEDDTYNPAEPTDDVSDVECDGYESWKGSSEDENEPEKVAKENGEQNAEESKDSESKGDSTKSAKKKMICYVCKVTCATEQKYRKHQASKAHTSKIDELLAIRKEKKQGSADDEKGISDREGRDGKKKSSRKPGNWCTVCECAFGGNFLAHRRTKEHRKKRDKKYPKCRPCRLGFSSSEEYRDHYKSEDHKIRSAEFHYLKGLASGSDDDEAAVQPVKVEPEEEEKVVDEIKMETEEAAPEEAKVRDEKMDEDSETDKEKPEESTTAEASEKKEETKKEKEKEKDKDKDKESESKTSEAKKSKPREPKALGQSFVVSVQGYYCKLCRKFFKDVTVAKSKHCRSVMHSTAFAKAMEEALEQEEERQKLAEEQDKLDQKAAEEAELAAEIAAIERAAKEAAKREAAKKKADIVKSDDIEMKDAPEGEQEKGDAKSGGEKDISSDKKIEENGVKEHTEPDSTDASIEKDEEKGSGDKPAEVQEESPDGDDDVDEEQEKETATKEEVTSSPATRRGRGRGRGRKRR